MKWCYLTGKREWRLGAASHQGGLQLIGSRNLHRAVRVTPARKLPPAASVPVSLSDCLKSQLCVQKTLE